jgi:uncharacterized protein (DUF1330 family)
VAAYVIVDVDVTDPQSYREYTAQTPGTVALYGGRWLVRGGGYETLEGEWSPRRIVLIEFPSVEQARAWYESPEYQAILPLRQQCADTRFLTIVAGV